jgi:hypothetical protein
MDVIKNYRTAIANYRRAADEHRRLALTHPEGNWRRAADIRVANKADDKANELERLMNQKIEALRIKA